MHVTLDTRALTTDLGCEVGNPNKDTNPPHHEASDACRIRNQEWVRSISFLCLIDPREAKLANLLTKPSRGVAKEGGGGGWGVCDSPPPPFCELCVSKQPTTGGQNDTTIW